MNKLDKREMEYVTGCTPHWRNPETKKYEPYPFSDERKAFLDSLLVEESDHVLYMDNHGVNIHLCSYRETTDGPLLGFLWGASSEECFYGTDYFNERELGFELTQKQVMTYASTRNKYRRADGGSWQL